MTTPEEGAQNSPFNVPNWIDPDWIKDKAGVEHNGEQLNYVVLDSAKVRENLNSQMNRNTL